MPKLNKDLGDVSTSSMLCVKKMGPGGAGLGSWPVDLGSHRWASRNPTCRQAFSHRGPQQRGKLQLQRGRKLLRPHRPGVHSEFGSPGVFESSHGASCRYLFLTGNTSPGQKCGHNFILESASFPFVSLDVKEAGLRSVC